MRVEQHVIGCVRFMAGSPMLGCRSVLTWRCQCIWEGEVLDLASSMCLVWIRVQCCCISDTCALCPPHCPCAAGSVAQICNASSPTVQVINAL